MADVLNKRNKVHHLDGYTEEDMYSMFAVDVDGKPRGNKRLMPSKAHILIFMAMKTNSGNRAQLLHFKRIRS